MIVANTNALAYLCIQGGKTADAQAAARRDPDWITAPLWRDEFLNVLVLNVTARRLTTDQALKAWSNAQGLMAGRESQVDAAATLELAVKSEITTYDAQFVLLAQRQGARLLTDDKELLRKFPATAISLAAFGAGA
jgi:predicted nucleic acid-binding protein